MPRGKYKRTEEMIKKIKIAQKNRYIKFPNLKKQISEKLKGNTHGFKKGQKQIKGAYRFPKGNKVNLGRKWLLETIEKRASKIRGEKSHFWKDGISFEPYSVDWTETLRKSIRERDSYICQLCNKPQGDIAHDVHHIDYDKKNCNPENLLTLCHSCNAKVNFKRNHWTKYFQQKIWQR